ncbi:SDR family NAD(P)-dependent oxidoreductase [Paraburkholderia sp. GAS334]|uniref:SDR family NAD(P)-dependent oxidoreductase n=1 Tax=Paraburkholderia sp. GAS334 TaxID=3035131 RepID=UPI003D25A368
MKIDLSQKMALITGSAQGIGFAIARGLAHAGASVVINGLTNEEVNRGVEKLRAEFTSVAVRGVVANVATAKGVSALVAAVPTVDILINNAGYYTAQDFFETPDDTWLDMFEVNVMGGVRTARAYLNGMAQRGWGRVVFISSESGLHIPVDMIHYGMTKTANLAVSRGLAKRMAGTGVTVNAVLPGPTLSEGLQAFFEEEQKKSGLPMEEIAAAFVVAHRPTSLVRRAQSVEEVANMVVYLSSPQASSTTGAALRVDGGIVDTIG